MVHTLTVISLDTLKEKFLLICIYLIQRALRNRQSLGDIVHLDSTDTMLDEKFHRFLQDFILQS